MKTIALVEDDLFIQDLTSIKLREVKYEVKAVSTGEELLSLLSSENVDLVLLDLDLPDVPGIEILNKIRGSEKFKNTPVIIYSNNDNPEIIKEVTAVGVQGFFTKATTAFEDLHNHIKTLLGE